MLTKSKKLRKKGQIWVETVIYTLIGLAIIGILLSIVNPAIKKKQDQIIIESSREMMSAIENTIEEVRHYGIGNSRDINLQIKKGKLEFNTIYNNIKFSIESNYQYSEIGQPIESGRLIIKTEKNANSYDVSLTLNYSGVLNLTWNEKKEPRSFQSSPNLQKVWITNRGKQGEQLLNIDFS